MNAYYEECNEMQALWSQHSPFLQEYNTVATLNTQPQPHTFSRTIQVLEILQGNVHTLHTKSLA